jgi:hypothetical protein
VYACTVVIRPCLIPSASWSTFATGARQFVVQDAFETMWCVSGSYVSKLTPRATVTSGSFAGAETITFLAPASRCFSASARARKRPVDSITTSTSRSAHGSRAGSGSPGVTIVRPSTTSAPSTTSTRASSAP